MARLFSKKISLIVLLFFLLVIPVAVYFTGQQQNTRQNAEGVSSPTTTSLAVHRTTPYLASTNENQPLIIKTIYNNPAGWQNLSEMAVWIDNHLPQSNRLNYSVHGKLKKIGNEFKFVGERYTGGGEICGVDQEIRHCYKNFVWDVGNFSTTSTTPPLYLNHDGQLQDTTEPTQNSIGNIRVKAIRELDATRVEVEWELSFGRFFSDKMLHVYTNATSPTESTGWRQTGVLRVNNDASRQMLYATEFSNDAETQDWQQTSGTGTKTLTDNAYIGKSSLQLSGLIGIQKDFGTPTEGMSMLYFYDDGEPTTNFYIAATTAPASEYNLASTQTVILAVDPTVSATHYIYKGQVSLLPSGENDNSPDKFRYFVTDILRTRGWHRVTFWATPQGGWAEVDNVTTMNATVNLGKIPLRFNRDSNDPIPPTKRADAHNKDLKKIRYLRAGTFNDDGSVLLDSVSVVSLPEIPLTYQNEPGATNSEKIVSAMQKNENILRWYGFTAANYLDLYEEMALFKHAENGQITDKWNFEYMVDTYCAGIPSEYKATAHCAPWSTLTASVADALMTRYSQTKLPIYKEMANRMYAYWIANAHSGYKWGESKDSISHASGESMSVFGSLLLGWTYFPAPLRAEFYTNLTEHVDYLIKGRNIKRYDAHIGDSSGEDTSWGPMVGPYRMGLFFTDHPYAKEWQDFSRAMSLRVFSTDENTLCASDIGYMCQTNPQGQKVVGYKSLYAPGEVPQDCPVNPDPTQSQACLCQGDRATIPLNRNFSYLFDNHSYSPHPGYMFGAMTGINMINSINRYNSSYGLQVPIPNEYRSNLRNVWNRVTQYYDYASFSYKPNDIYRIREKRLCNGAVSEEATPELKDRGPISESENWFRTKGVDSRGNPASFDPTTYLSVTDALGADALSSLPPDLIETLVNQAFLRDGYSWGGYSPPNQFFRTEDLDCHFRVDFMSCYNEYNPNSKLFLATRANPWQRPNIMLPEHKPPLKVCEENIFKKKVWNGVDMLWDCVTNEKIEGKESLMLSSTNDTTAELFSPLMKVKPGTYYKISYSVKTQSLTPSGATVYGRIIPAQFRSDAHESDNLETTSGVTGTSIKINDGYTSGENVGGTTNWTTKSYVVKTDQSASYIRLRAPLGLVNGTVTGKVWYDNIKLEETSAPPTPRAMGDIIGTDGKIDLLDFARWLCEYRGNGACTTPPPSNKTANLNPDKDSIVDLLDFSIWLEAFRNNP